MKTKKATKLMAVTGLTCEIVKTLLLINDKLNKDRNYNLKQLHDTKLLELMSHLLNHE